MKALFKRVGDTIRGVLNRIRPAPIAQSVGENLIALIRKNFANEVDPYGDRWVAHSPRYWRMTGGRREPKPYKIMVHTGRLLNSFVHHTEADLGGKATVVVSNSTPYFAYHQEGRGANPVRLIFPTTGRMPDTWLLQSKDIALRYVSNQINGS